MVTPEGQRRRGLSDPAALLTSGRAVTAVLVAVWLACVLWGLRRLPVQPGSTGDTSSYLNGDEHRPHGYFLFLKAYRAVVGDLDYLAHVQFLMLAAALLLLALVAARVLRAGLWLVPIFPAVLLLQPSSNVNDVMADAPLEVAIVCAVAFLLLVFAGRSIGWLLAVGAMAGAALALKSSGLFLLPPIAAALLVHAVRRGLGARWVATAAVLIAAPVAAALLLVATSNAVVNGDFRVGSWGGMSILGKGLVLARPLPADSPAAELDWIGQETMEVGPALDRIDNPVLRALAARSYYEVLRWYVFFPRFSERLPGWSEASSYEMGKIAGDVAWTFVRNDPAGYARLVLLDYASLWFVPKLMTRSEAAALEAEWAALGPMPFLTEFEASVPPPNRYFLPLPYEAGRLLVYSLRIWNAVFLLGSVAFAVVLLRRRWRDRLPSVPGVVLVLGTVHVSYAATVLVEGGLDRYTAPTWPLLVLGAILALRLPVDLRRA